MSQTSRIWVRSLDFAAFLLAVLAFWGGIDWHGQVVLRHAADLRRAAILILLFGACFTVFREESRALRLVFRFTRWLETSCGRRLFLAGACTWAIALGVAQTLAMRFPLFDVGIFHQIIWNLAHSNGFSSTLSGAGDFLHDHLALTLALYVPVFKLVGDSPLTLPVLHPLLLFGGASAWIWLASRMPIPAERRAKLAAAATIFVVCFDSFWGNLHWGFHENATAFAALSWAFALWIVGNRGGYVVVLLLLAAFSKEILLVDVGLAFAAWSIFEAKSRRFFKSLSLFGLGAVLIWAFVLYERSHHPADKNYFDRYYSYLGHGLGEFLGSLLTDPFRVVRAIGGGELLRYFFAVFAPFLALPFFLRRSRSLAWWGMAAVPSFLSAALSTYPPLRQPGFHYVLELWPWLAALTIVALSELEHGERLAWAWALAAVFMLDHDPWNDLRDHAQAAAAMSPVRARISAVPVELSVVADELAGPWIASREMLGQWDRPWPAEYGCPSRLILPLGNFGALGRLEGSAIYRRCVWKVDWRERDWVGYSRVFPSAR